ncbi:MAG: O-antigen ligase family protein [Brevinema sp.]
MVNKSILWISFLYTSLFIILLLAIQSNYFIDNNTHMIPTIPSLMMILTVIIVIFLLSIHHFRVLPTKQKTLGVSLIFLILLSPFGDYCLPFLALSIILLLDKQLIKKLLFTYDYLDYSWLIFIVWCFISSVFANNDKVISFAMTTAFLGFGILFKILRYTRIPHHISQTILFLFGSSISTVILFSLYHMILNQNINLLGIILYPNGDPGLASFLSNWPANTAGFLVMSLSILIYQCVLAFKNNSHQLMKIFLIGTSIIIFIGLLATQTRMAFLFIIGSLTALIVFYPFKRFRTLRFSILLIPILIMPILSVFSTKWKETLTSPLKQSTIQDRIHQNLYGFSLWKEHPITGVGLMNFRYFYDDLGDPIIKKLKPGHPRIEFLHNIYMSMLVETGIIGLLLFLGSIMSLAYYFWKHRLLFGLCFLSGALAVGLVDGWLFVLRFSLMMFLILGYSTHIIFPNRKV